MIFFKHTTAKRAHHQKICTTTNIKGSPSGRRIIPGGNIEYRCI